MHRFATPRGWRLVNFTRVLWAEEAGIMSVIVGDDQTITGPAVRLWFDNGANLVINSTLEQIEGLTQ